MSLELIRETIKINRLVSEDSTQTVVENDIIVPDVKPDIDHILLLDGDITVNDAEVLQDRMLINGSIRYKILYIPDTPEHEIKSINTDIRFSSGMDVPEARQGMRCRIRCDIEHIDYSIVSGRKINIKTIVKLNGKVFEEVQQNVVSDLRGLEGLQVLKEGMNINCYLGSSKTDYAVKENLEIPGSKPAVREILRNDLKITGKDYKIADNRIIVKGVLNISTLFTGDDETKSIQYMEHEIPFTQFVELEGIDDAAGCEVDYLVNDARYEAKEDSDGEMRILNAEIDMALTAWGFRKRSIETVQDAYNPDVRLELVSEPFKTEGIAAENRSQAIIKDSIIISDSSPGIVEVINVLCKPVLSEYGIFEDRIVIEGFADCNVLYLADNPEQPVSCQRQEVSFKHAVDVKGVKNGMACDVDLDLEHCNYSMISSKEVETRLVIGVNLKILEQVELPLPVKVGEYQVEDKRSAHSPSIVIYFAQTGDTMWKIAKRYLTTVTELQKANGLSERDTISPGQQIVIFRKQPG